MNFKTPFKVLTTATLISTLSLSAVLPGVASAQTTKTSVKAEVAQDIAEVVLVKDGKHIKLSYNDFSNAFGSTALEGYTVAFVVADTGSVYDYETYGMAYEKGSTPKEVFAKLEEAGIETTTEPKNTESATFDEDGNLVIGDAEEDFGVVEISAINATDANFTVKFGSDVTEADLKDVKINLEGPSELTASFVKLEGKTATFKVDQDILNKAAYNGDYKPAAIGIKFADSAKTTYTATVTDTTVEGFVTTDNVQGDSTAAANVKVKVGDTTVITDENGYYKAPASAGLVDVVVDAGTGYFESEFKEQEVKRNFSTVVNAHTKKIIQAELAIDGKLVDAKTGDAIKGATVKLQKEVDGEWVTIGEATTSNDNASTGRYVFFNDKVEATTANTLKTAVDSNTDGFTDLSTALDSEEFEYGDKLRVVASKEVSKANLHNNYETKTINVTTSKTGPATNLLDELRPIGEVKKFDLDLNWEDLTGTDNDADFTTTGADVTLIGTDGKTALTEAVSLSSIKASSDKELTDALDLVAKDVFLNGGSDQKPNLPTGTYFLKVDDGTNAIAYVPVKVTEATDASATATIEKARTLGTTTKFAGFTYDTALSVSGDTNNLSTIDDSDAKGADVEADINIFKEISGVDVLVATASGENFTVAYDPSIPKASATLEYAVAQLAKGDYKIQVATDYALDGEANGTAKVEAKAVNTANEIQVAPASTLEVEVVKKGDSVTKVAEQKVTVELLDANNKVVASYEDITDVDGNVKLTGVKPGTVKVKVTPVGTSEYKAGTATKTTTIKDIQDQKQQVELEAIEKPVVQGYVKYADDFANVEEGTVAVYDESGKLVTYSDLVAQSTSADNSGKYKFEGLKEGSTYKFVVRGVGFETTSQTVKVEAGENTPVNFKVEQGGKGQAKYIVTDKLNKAVAGVEATAYDSLYSGTTAVAPAYDATNDTTAGFAGAYEFAQSGNVFKTEEALSKDSYTVEFEDANSPAVYKDKTTTFTIANKNANYDGPAIQLELLSGALTSKISGTVNTDSVITTNKIDYVVVFNKDGEFVTRTADLDTTNFGTTFEVVVDNGQTYTLAYYANGAFVGSKQVSVQDYDVTGVTLTGDKAER